MTDEHPVSPSVFEKLLAILLALGGLLGIGMALYFGPEFFRQHWIYLVLLIAMAAAFGAATYAGILYLRGRRKGWKWATVLYGSQIPVITVPGLSYEWYTSFAVQLIFVGDRDPVTFSLGSSLTFFLDTRITQVLLGINIFAIIAFVYLFLQKGKWSGAAEPAETPATNETD